jgi:hypothetical protein
MFDGNVCFDAPPFANQERYGRNIDMALDDACYIRAVWTAEAFIMLFQQHNPRFDTQRFLIACGLVEKLAKVRK